MDAAALIARLEVLPAVLPALVGGLSGADARWKPPSGAWSVLEVVNHLVDEEVEDFRRRLELTLRDPALPWPKNDPEGWATARRYNERELGESLRRFLMEREASLRWLRSLRDPDWTRAYQHPIGPLAAGDLMTSWAAHDTLHIRQIAKRLYELAGRDGAPYSSAYAGQWGA